MAFKLLDIKKNYKAHDKESPAVNGITLDINEGDFISFVGPSGAGKTTLLLLIAGLIRPTSGDIYFNDEKLTRLPDRQWSLIRKNRMGIVFQKKIVIPHLRVYENIIAPLSFRYTSDETPFLEKAEELMEIFGLSSLKNRYPSELSGGELQKLIVARSLVTRPSILLADEPTGDLDIYAATQLLNILKILNKQGLTIVMVTHNKELAAITRTIYRIEEGRITKVLR